MPRILHTADWQLGRQYARFEPDDAAILADARFQAVKAIAELAVKESVDAIVVAGDVFDMQTVSERTLRRPFQDMSAFPGPWILLPGNHDAALADSVWSRARQLKAVPDNVHLALTPEVIQLPEPRLAILPAPLTQRQTHEDLTEWFDQAESPDGALRIGLAHGSVQGMLREEIDSPNPISADRAENARLDYLALGDWHGTKKINARTWYSGTPEQDRFKNNDPGQVLLVDIPAAGGEPTITPVAIGQYPWRELPAHLTVNTDLDDLILQLQRIPAGTVLSVTVSGQVDLKGQQALNDALGEASGRCRSLEANLDELRLAPTDDDIAHLHADGYLADVVADLQAAQQSENASVAREALTILAGLLLDQQRNRESTR